METKNRRQMTNLKNMIDIGANLAAKDFDADLSQVLQAGFDAGIEKIIITGSCFNSIPKAQQIVLDYSKKGYKNKLFYTAGIHPHHSDEWNQKSASFIESFAKDEYCVATGEMGLDFFRNFVDRKIQLETFRSQLDVAIKMQKPIFIHERDASETMLEELKTRQNNLPKVVIHCFTGTKETLAKYLEAGFYIGITGWICDPVRGAHLLDAIDIIPHNRLMIETDSPYLMPKNIRPKPKSRRNEPKNLGIVAEKIAEILSMDTQTLIDKTSASASEFFGLDKFV